MHAIVRWTILLVALSPFAFYILVLYAARRFFGGRTAEPPADFTPPVSVLKPVRGLDRNSYENFSSFCTQNYPDYEIIFGVSEASDPVVPIIERLIRDFPQRKIRLIIGVEPLGTNDKVNKLARMVRESQHDILVISDSDMLVEPHYLTSVARLFRDPKVGAVTCPYRGSAGKTFASELEVIGNSTEFQPGVLVAWLLEGVKFALGATMGVRRNCLAEIGGFKALANYYSDDFELGNRVAARGHRVELCQWPIITVFPEQTLKECYRHQLRWALTTRHSRPLGHVGLGLTFGLPWSVAAALVARLEGAPAGVRRINFYTPTFKAYSTSEIGSCGKSAWPAVSITAGECKLQCDHCKAKILEPMIPATSPEALWRTVNEQVAQGARGMLLTGGSNHRDEVEYGPFLPTVRDGVLHGRGAADMKGSIAAMVTACERFIGAHPAHRGSIAFLLTSDEEGPAVDGTVKVLEWLEARNERLDACLVGEPTSAVRLGDMVKVGRRGSLSGRLTVRGVQGHTAYPHLADNPIPKLLRMLGALIEKPLDRGSDHFEPSNIEITTRPPAFARISRTPERRPARGVGNAIAAEIRACCSTW